LKDIRIHISADASSVVRAMGQAETAISDTGQAATRAGTQVEGLGDRMTSATARAAAASERYRAAVARSSSGTGAFGRGLQTAGFQVGDFAVQLHGGTAASIALAQQLPQLLGGFGVLGAVLGAAAAIFGPMITRMAQTAAETGTLTASFGTLQPVADAVVTAFERLRDTAVVMGTALADNLDRVIIIAGTAATLFAGRWVASMVAANLATMTFAGSLAFLRTALIRTGIGAVVIAAGELIFQFTRLVQATGSFSAAMGLLADVGREVFGRIAAAGGAMGELLRGAFLGLVASWNMALSDMLVSFTSFVQTVAQGFRNIGVHSVADALNPVNAGGFTTGGLAGALIEGGNQAFDAGEEAQSDSVAAIASGTAQFGALAAPLAGVQAIRDVLAGMRDENLTVPGVLSGDAAGEGGGAGGGMSRLQSTIEQAKGMLDEFRDYTRMTLGEQLGAWGSYFGDLANLVGSGNEKILAVSKSFAAAQALINAWEGYAQTLRDPTLPWFAKFAAAGKVLAAGFGAVNAIKGIGRGGSGGRGGAGAAGAGTGSVGAAEAPAGTFVNVSLVGGDMFGPAQMRQFGEALNRAIEQGLVIRGVRFT
jgi:hypothetical protein